MGVKLAILNIMWKTVEKNDRKRIASQTPTPGLEEVIDVPYLDDGLRAHLLDVYYPRGTAEPLPVIIDIHGGGWMYGYKEINKNYCLYLASRGFTVFSINYRLAPEVVLYNQINDVMCALSWIGEHLGDYPCDTRRVFLTGDSAGGQLAAYAALLNSSGKLRELYSVKENSLRFSAVALTSPVCELTGGGLSSFTAAPVLGKGYLKKPYGKYINFSAALPLGKMPPTFLVTSSGDFIARKQTRKAYGLIKQSGTPCALEDYEKWNGKPLIHVFSVIDTLTDAGRDCVDKMLAFFKMYE